MKPLGRILLLEDEPFIALDMEEMLREFGASEIVTFDMRSAAMAWLTSNKPDLAVIDPRLTDGICIDVVEKLSNDGCLSQSTRVRGWMMTMALPFAEGRC
jgi:two-component SAPR family response regulator